jgi:translation initiation factor 2 subunit 3
MMTRYLISFVDYFLVSSKVNHVNRSKRSIDFRLAVKNDMSKLSLTHPVCADVGEKVALSRRVSAHWRLVGWAQITKGK